MRVPAIPLLLSGLLAGVGLAPAAASAYPYTVQRYTVETYTPRPRPVTVRPVTVRPVTVAPVAPLRERRCQPGSVLTGAVVGGGLGAVLADGSRSRRWAVPMGAAVGGLVGGVASGC